MELGSTWFKVPELAALKQESVWGEVTERKKKGNSALSGKRIQGAVGSKAGMKRTL